MKTTYNFYEDDIKEIFANLYHTNIENVSIDICSVSEGYGLNEQGVPKVFVNIELEGKN